MANDFAIIERALKLGESRSIKSQSKAYQEAFLALQSLRERFLEGMAFALESDPETSEAKSGERSDPAPTSSPTPEPASGDTASTIRGAFPNQGWSAPIREAKADPAQGTGEG